MTMRCKELDLLFVDSGDAPVEVRVLDPTLASIREYACPSAAQEVMGPFGKPSQYLDRAVLVHSDARWWLALR